MVNLCRMERKFTSNRWTIFVGSILWLMGFALNVILAPGEGIECKLFLSISVFFKWFWSILLFVVVIPFFAEGVFRYWGTGERTSIWFSIICMVLSVVVICIKANGLVMGIVSVLSVVFIAIILYFQLRNERKPARDYVLLIIGSTFIWIAYYVSRIGELQPYLFFSVPKLIGLSLICCYMVVNHGVLYAVLAHAINNLIVAIPLIVVGCKHDNVEITIKDTDIKLQRVYTEERIDSYSDEHVLLQGNIKDIVSMIAQQNNNSNVLYVPCGNDGVLNYRLLASAENKVYPRNILSAMEKTGYIVMDTSYEPLWMIEIPALSQMKDLMDGEIEVTTLDNFANWIRQQYQIPIILDPALNPQLPIPFLEKNEMKGECNTLGGFISHVDKKYGMKINRLPYDKACVIKINCL